MTGAITFDILARDAASKVVRGVGDELDTLSGRAAGFARKFAASIGIAFGAEKLAEFGKSAVEAFTSAQSAEAKLEGAFQRFPKLADTTVAAMRRVNDEIERRTGFLSKDLAVGEANLAQFNLTGAQLKQITPLLVDYADKTGQDIPESATLLGRALLGNQRALKSIGIVMPAVTASAKEMAKAHKDVETTSTALTAAQDRMKLSIAEMQAKRKVSVVDEIRYKDTQTALQDAYNKNQAALAALRGEQDKTAQSGSYFDQVVGALKTKVGGFADQESQTAQGQLRKLSAEFERVKVEVGAKLLPVVLSFGHFLTGTLIPDLEGTASWLKRNEDTIVPLVKVVGGLTAAVLVTNKATALWTSASKAATTWARALGAAAATSAPEVAAEGAAAEGAAAKNAALAGSARAAATDIEAAGASAAANAGRLTGFLGLLAKVGPLAIAAAGAVAVKSIIDRSQQQGQNTAALTARALASPLGYSTVLGELGNLQAHNPGGPADSIIKSYQQALANADAARRAQAAAAADPYRNASNTGEVNNGLPTKGLAAAVTSHPATVFAAKTAAGVKNILAGLPTFAIGSGTGIADGIAKGIKAREQRALSAAKSLASRLTSQINSIRSSLDQFTSGVAGTITGNASLLNTGNQSVQGLLYFQQHQLSIDTTFHRNLARLVKLGFSPVYISQLAQAGPMQAGGIVANLAQASTSQVRQLNATAQQIGASARATANTAAADIYHKQYAELQKQTIELRNVKKEIARITADLDQLARTGHLQTTARPS